MEIEKEKLLKEIFLEVCGINLHERQEEIYKSTARYKTVAAGRRFGKSFYAAYAEIIPRLLMREKRIWIAAPTYDLANKIFREVLAFFIKNKDLCEKVNASRMFIQSISGSTLQAKSTDNPASLMGEGLDLLVIDECAVIESYVFYEYLRPTLADRRGKGVFISTPKGKNWFYELYMMGLNGGQGYESFRFTTYDNPLIAKEEVDEAKALMPEHTFNQEFLAIFGADENAVFTNVDEIEKRPIRNAEGDEAVSIGLDLAKKQDFTVITALSVRSGEILGFERFNRLPWNETQRRILRFYSAFENAKIFADSSGVGDPVVDALKEQNADVEGLVFTNSFKRNLIEKLLMRMEEGSIFLTEEPVLLEELKAFRYYYGKRSIRYEGRSSVHDDCVISLALAVWGAEARNFLHKSSLAVDIPASVIL